MLLALFVLVIQGCTERSGVGSELIRGLDEINPTFTDTLTVETQTVSDDSIISILQSNYQLGSMDDPVMGKTFGGVYFQPRLPANNVDFGEGLQLDSVVLKLNYNSAYGNGDYKPSFMVYRMRENFRPFVFYRNSTTFQIDPQPLGQKENISLHPSDSTLLRIPLNRSFGQELLSQSGGGNFANNSSFLSYLNGLFIVPDTSTGYGENMLSINMTEPESALYLYYQTAEEDSLVTVFPINSNSAVSSYSTHQYDNPDIKNQLAGQPPVNEKVYIQGMGGLATKITVPHLKDLGPVSVNKAELVVTVLPSEKDTVFPAPNFISPQLRRDTTARFFQSVPDQGFADQVPAYDLGGDKEEVTIDGQQYFQYRINLIRHFQGQLRDTVEMKPVYLRPVSAVRSPGRAVLGAGNHSNNDLRTRLRLFYTKK